MNVICSSCASTCPQGSHVPVLAIDITVAGRRISVRRRAGGRLSLGKRKQGFAVTEVQGNPKLDF